MNKQSKIVIFCGKGGVGKTTLSLAYGLAEAQKGQRVVLVSSHPLPELAVAVSLAGLSLEMPDAAKKLFVVHLDAKELLAEVVEKNFPVQWVARAVLHSQIYRNLVTVAPGLKEFYFLARMQQLAERTRAASPDGPPDYDLLLWDAPSMGHFISTLRAARSFEVYLSGPLAAAGADMNRFFSNADHIGVLPATTLEEMAIEETIEMCRTLEHEFQLRPSAVLMNQVSPLCAASEGEVAAVERQLQANPSEALQFAVERGMLERSRAAELHQVLKAPGIAVERIREFRNDLDLLRQAGQSLEGLAI
jgi:hypothetical protein